MHIDIMKLILSTATGGFGMWIVAGLWHNLIMAHIYEEVHAKHEGIGLLLVAYFILAGLMSHMSPLVYQDCNPFTEGI